MEALRKDGKQSEKRRQRLHELLIALIQTQDEIELMDIDSPGLKNIENLSSNDDPARLLDRNRRILSKYQSLVRSAITLDALLDSE
tara:strand:- start:141 stop:398 length:258 start_codon:yes stop_codon:yes gene_type:complete